MLFACSNTGCGGIVVVSAAFSSYCSRPPPRPTGGTFPDAPSTRVVFDVTESVFDWEIGGTAAVEKQEIFGYVHVRKYPGRDLTSEFILA
jgi:hypothetical protein